MLCIDLAKLSTIILWGLVISNFMVILVIMVFGVKDWNKTADIVNPNRSFNNYRYDEIDSIKQTIDRLREETRIELFKKEDKVKKE